MIGRRPRLVLASASPRRRQLLADRGYDFEVVAPVVKELHSDKLTLREATCYNALRKGLIVARAYPGRGGPARHSCRCAPPTLDRQPRRSRRSGTTPSIAQRLHALRGFERFHRP